MNRILSISLLILWMIFIFLMSSFNASDSTNQSSSIVLVLSDVLNIHNVDLLSVIVRKIAHFTEYFILGILTSNAFKDFRVKKIFIYCLIFCVFYACTDEIHQLFVPGRSGNFIDILIDSFGSLSGCVSYFLLLKKCRN